MLSSLDGFGLLVFIVSLLIAMGVHEATHAYVAHALGDTTASDLGRLTLNPIKHIDVYTTLLLPVVLVMLGMPPFFAAKPVPFNPARVKYDEYGAALIGISGPFSNLIMAGLAALVVRGLGISGGTLLLSVLLLFIQINLALFVFNMIPFPPLDGSRLLYAFAPEPLQRVMYQIESGGIMSILLFIFVLFRVLGPAVIFVNTKLLNFLL